MTVLYRKTLKQCSATGGNNVTFYSYKEAEGRPVWVIILALEIEFFVVVCLISYKKPMLIYCSQDDNLSSTLTMM